MEKYLSGNPLAKVPHCKTWSMAGKRAYERINHEPTRKDSKSAWQEAFRRCGLSWFQPEDNRKGYLTMTEQNNKLLSTIEAQTVVLAPER